MSVRSESEWSELNEVDGDSTHNGTDWEVLSQDSNASETIGSTVSHVSNALNRVVAPIAEDNELPILPLSAIAMNRVDENSQENSIDHKENEENNDNKQDNKEDNKENSENKEKKNNSPSNQNVAFVRSYIDIEAELERQRRVVAQLRESLNQVGLSFFFHLFFVFCFFCFFCFLMIVFIMTNIK